MNSLEQIQLFLFLLVIAIGLIALKLNTQNEHAFNLLLYDPEKTQKQRFPFFSFSFANLQHPIFKKTSRFKKAFFTRFRVFFNKTKSVEEIKNKGDDFPVEDFLCKYRVARKLRMKIWKVELEIRKTRGGRLLPRIIEEAV